MNPLVIQSDQRSYQRSFQGRNFIQPTTQVGAISTNLEPCGFTFGTWRRMIVGLLLCERRKRFFPSPICESRILQFHAMKQVASFCLCNGHQPLFLCTFSMICFLTRSQFLQSNKAFISTTSHVHFFKYTYLQFEVHTECSCARSTHSSRTSKAERQSSVEKIYSQMTFFLLHPNTIFQNNQIHKIPEGIPTIARDLISQSHVSHNYQFRVFLSVPSFSSLETVFLLENTQMHLFWS